MEQQQNQTQKQENTKIYVSNFEGDISEEELLKMFKQHGTITNSKVIQAKTAVFITYSTKEEAQKAVDEENGRKLIGKCMRVALVIDTKSLEPKANLFVKNLNPLTNDSTLKEYFSKFGKVMSCKIVLNTNQQSTQKGYVQMETVQQAEKILEKPVHNIDEYDVSVEQYKNTNKKFNSQNCVTLKVKTDIYSIIKPKNANPEGIKEVINNIFKEFGQIENINVVNNQTIVIQFKQDFQAKKAAQEFNGKDIFQSGEVEVTVRNQNSEQQTQENDNQLFANRLKDDVTVEQIKEAFKDLNIQDATIREPKGYKQAILTFKDKEAAELAIINGSSFKQIRNLFKNKVLLNIYVDQQTLRSMLKYKQETQKEKTQQNYFEQQQQQAQQLAQMQMMYNPMMQNFQRRGFNGYQNGYRKPMGFQNRQQQPQPYSRNHYQRQQGGKFQNQGHRNHNYYGEVNNKIKNEVTRLQNKLRTGQDPEQAKEEVWKELGTKIYPLVEAELANEDDSKRKIQKITGMIIDLDNNDIDQIVPAIFKREILQNQIAEALASYNQFQQQ